MPQLSPMMGFLMFVVILFSYTILLSGLGKKLPLVKGTKVSKSLKKSFKFFN